ncbi:MULTISPECIES: hypothetical protein [unclassified Cyanobium]|uniref:hypothetical protein n=1 Tax=unclassified Cyanobium TaxID=2627006 RepID=UPI0020CF420D|nr:MULTISPECIES: hypothetical protein [unclassified Cyanobium]MCP9857850.1 hypothetical protein [Cyanobium sp. Cruz-8H5]MCP9865093.1 hypothetical protein [Cyanobium sp. Cruz-8D1]
MTATDKEVANSDGKNPSRAVPAQPAYTPSGWPANQAPSMPSVLTPGQAQEPPASFSFGEVVAAGGETVSSPRDAIDAEPTLLAPDQPPAPPQAPRAAGPGPSGLAITTTGPDAQQLEMELAAARDELKALHEMLEDLPEIFERKFQQRLATVLEHQKHLLDDNRALRERLYSLNPTADLPPPGSGRPQPLLLPTVARKEGWGQAMKRALRLGRPEADGTTRKISRHDDGRPITA